MTQLPKKTQKNGDTNKSKRKNILNNGFWWFYWSDALPDANQQKIYTGPHSFCVCSLTLVPQFSKVLSFQQHIAVKY